MGNIQVTYLPPQNWQDFEKFLRGVVDVIWKQQSWQNYGRTGQDQSGIDLYGYDEKGRVTAIQCKKTGQTDEEGKLLTKSLITKALLEKEITAAESMQNPQIQRLIFATTSPRDTGVQDIMRSINDKRIKNGRFMVEIWFWEDFQVLIEKHIELMYLYFSDVLDKVHIYDRNVHVLVMLRQAFTRQAFSREMNREESGVDFIQAIKNTMEAITTGRLYNRRGDLIATSFDYKQIINSKWRDAIWKINEKLDEIRTVYQQGVKTKKIIEHQTYLDILDDLLSEKLNTLRRECLKELNVVLIEAKLEKVDSQLL